MRSWRLSAAALVFLLASLVAWSLSYPADPELVSATTHSTAWWGSWPHHWMTTLPPTTTMAPLEISEISETSRESPVTTTHKESEAPVTTGSTADGWEDVRQCESGGNYGYNDGTYRGAYNFDDQTWRTVGGTGSADDASPAEQDARAQRLYNERGSAPWPRCGRHLR